MYVLTSNLEVSLFLPFVLARLVTRGRSGRAAQGSLVALGTSSRWKCLLVGQVAVWIRLRTYSPHVCAGT